MTCNKNKKHPINELCRKICRRIITWIADIHKPAEIIPDEFDQTLRYSADHINQIDKIKFETKKIL